MLTLTEHLYSSQLFVLLNLCSVFCVVFCRSFFVILFFFLVIVLSVLRFTASDYRFGIFNLFLDNNWCMVVSIWTGTTSGASIGYPPRAPDIILVICGGCSICEVFSVWCFVDHRLSCHCVVCPLIYCF